MIRITKEFNFEMSHALKGHDGKCANIHGHSYQLSVTVKGIPLNDHQSPKNGMVMDFSDLKTVVKEKIIHPFDHALVLNEEDDRFDVREQGKLVTTPFQPTCENMLTEFVKRIKHELPEGVDLYSMRLRETRSSYAEWFASDNI